MKHQGCGHLLAASDLDQITVGQSLAVRRPQYQEPVNQAFVMPHRDLFRGKHGGQAEEQTNQYGPVRMAFHVFLGMQLVRCGLNIFLHAKLYLRCIEIMRLKPAAENLWGVLLVGAPCFSRGSWTLSPAEKRSLLNSASAAGFAEASAKAHDQSRNLFRGAEALLPPRSTRSGFRTTFFRSL